MNAEELVASYLGREVGRVRRSGAQLDFTYAPSWRASGAFPLSVSMPLAAARHGHEKIEPFLWNLLPDNEWILERWAKRFHVSARSPFRLLAHIGEDCAGAIAFVEPGRAATLAEARPDDVRWLREDDVAERLRLLREDHSVTRLESDEGQFSLAGAQPKIALLHREGRWGVPAGATPTTHILKPPLADYPGHVLNEHVCLRVARALGLPTASSRVARFGEELAIVVERYDRLNTSVAAAAAAAEAASAVAAVASAGAESEVAEAAKRVATASARATALGALAERHPILRLHQEDLCQALGLRPSAKYQAEGGPGPREVADLLRAWSSAPMEDLHTFRDALIFNWIIGGTDAHAKNYSVLHGTGGRVRLAPLYDLASALPYLDIDPRKLKLAMKIGRTYRLADVQPGDWASVAAEMGLDAQDVIGRVTELASRLGGALDATLRSLAAEELTHPILVPLERSLRERASAIDRRLR